MLTAPHLIEHVCDLVLHLVVVDEGPEAPERERAAATRVDLLGVDHLLARAPERPLRDAGREDCLSDEGSVGGAVAQHPDDDLARELALLGRAPALGAASALELGAGDVR